MYSFAPASIAFTASRALVPIPQATTGTKIRSASRSSTSLPIFCLTSHITTSAPLPLRKAPMASMISSQWMTFAPRCRAILPAVLM